MPARFLYDNLAIRTATVITVSSEQPSFPAVRLRASARTKTWRSKVGWNVGDFNKLDFVEGGTARVATLTAGNYSADLFAVELQTRINAAAVSNTYTVTYSASTKKVTIARATGVATISLPWASGANALVSCGKDLGFDTAADDTGATSYTGDNAAYHSREWIKFNLGSALSAQVALALAHNAGAGGVFRLQGNATDAWTAPSVNVGLPGDSAIRIAYMAPGSFQWQRILIDDVGNAAGYSEVGVPFIGPYLQLSRSFALRQARGDALVDYSRFVIGGQGALFQTKGAVGRRLQGLFPSLSAGEKSSLYAMQQAVGVGGPLFFAREAAGNPADTRYGALAEPFSFDEGESPDELYDVPLSFIEAL